MKILIATGLYPPDMGGPATYTVFLEKHLPKNNIDYVTVSYGSVRKYPPLVRHVIYAVKLLLHSRGVDTLYALDTVSVGLPVRIVSFVSRKPYLLRVPGDYAWEQGQQRYGIDSTLDEYLQDNKKPIKVKMLAWIQNHVAQHALHIIVPSDYLKKVVMQWGVAGSKITRVYSALKEIEVPQTKEELRLQFGYAKWTLITAGRLVPWKGVDVLIQIVKIIKDSGIDVQLEILGDGVCRKELEDLTVSLNLTQDVIFRGVLAREDMARRIKAADIFILNTSYEGLSHQLIEVMSLGTPIVTTDVGGNPELITHRQTGVLVPYNDTQAIYEACVRFHQDPELAAQNASSARERIKEFHEDVVVKEFIIRIRSLWNC